MGIDVLIIAVLCAIQFIAYMQHMLHLVYKVRSCCPDTNRPWQTNPAYLAARALWGHVSEGFLVLLQDLRQGDITAFTGNIKY